MEKFVTTHPVYAKRQVELKIGELAVKEKQENDTCKVWHIKPEFAKFLTMEVDQPAFSAADRGEGQSSAVTDSGKRKAAAVLDGDAKGAGSAKKARKDDDAQAQEPKKFKRAFGFFVKAKRSEAEEKLGADTSVGEVLQLIHGSALLSLFSFHGSA